jgi:hypothetical protein
MDHPHHHDLRWASRPTMEAWRRRQDPVEVSINQQLATPFSPEKGP